MQMLQDQHDVSCFMFHIFLLEVKNFVAKTGVFLLI